MNQTRKRLSYGKVQFTLNKTYSTSLPKLASHPGHFLRGRPGIYNLLAHAQYIP